jgi:hypothetical protein
VLVLLAGQAVLVLFARQSIIVLAVPAGEALRGAESPSAGLFRLAWGVIRARLAKGVTSSF